MMDDEHQQIGPESAAPRHIPQHDRSPRMPAPDQPTGDPTRCRDCGSVHPDEKARVRCAVLCLQRDHLTHYAATLDNPPATTSVLDLWAHARRHGDDGSIAARWVQTVLDLGWRPAVAS